MLNVKLALGMSKMSTTGGHECVCYIDDRLKQVSEKDINTAQS